MRRTSFGIFECAKEVGMVDQSPLPLPQHKFIVANTGACGPLSASSDPKELKGSHRESTRASWRASTCQPAPVESNTSPPSSPSCAHLFRLALAAAMTSATTDARSATSCSCSCSPCSQLPSSSSSFSPSDFASYLRSSQYNK